MNATKAPPTGASGDDPDFPDERKVMSVMESTPDPPNLNGRTRGDVLHQLIEDALGRPFAKVSDYLCPAHNVDLTFVTNGQGVNRLHCFRCESSDHLVAAMRRHADDAPMVYVESDSEEHEYGEDLDAFLDTSEPEYNWVVEGLLERRDRVILTGPEKAGKSTLLRQVAVRFAAGLHPFDERRTEPANVFFVDTENNRADQKRKFRPLRDLVRDAGGEPGGLQLISRPGGLDLRRPESLELLDEIADFVWVPDVLVIGPAYKLGSGDPSSEEVAREVTGALDAFRTKHDCAVLLEHHTPHAGANGRRPHRPIGSSLWGRWCEVALHLSAQGVLSRWQPMRDPREWPEKLRRGDTWPWVAETASAELAWGRVVGLIEERGCLSQRELAKELELSKGTVQRVLESHREEWAEICGSEAA